MRVPVPEQDPKERINNFCEVSLGYTEQQAITEAKRCLQCEQPSCVERCPVKINIPKFIKNITKQNFDKALEVIMESNNLPGICGRVCPQEQQCESACRLAKRGEAINIGKLERFVADHCKKRLNTKIKKKKEKVAVIGSGPAGLTVAADLALLGYNVTIFEALHKPGGVLTYGIPEFRLPKEIVEKEIGNIKRLGVKIKTNVVIGKTLLLKELEENFDAVFIGVGAGLPYFMKIPGENLPGVYSANEFLTRINLMKAHEFPNSATPVKRGKKTLVIGGGNVAIDAARVARRLGSDVTVVYRRSVEEMPARLEEIIHARDEGVKFLMLTNPVRIIGKDYVECVECVQMMLGEEDDTGRRTPIPIEGTEFIIEADQVIVAIGQGPNPILIRSTDLELGEGRTILVDEKMQTSHEKVFAGGDITCGNATVIKAIADGKRAARAIDEYLRNKRYMLGNITKKNI